MVFGTTVAVALLIVGTPAPLQLAAFSAALSVTTSALWLSARMLGRGVTALLSAAAAAAAAAAPAPAHTPKTE
jgi:hypothetical protein